MKKVFGFGLALVLLVGCCALLWWERVDLLQKNSALQHQVVMLSAVVNAAENAMSVREEARTEAFAKTQEKRHELDRLSKNISGISDDELFFALHRMCVEDGACADSPPGNPSR